jgi:hypothetical protein
LEAAGRTAGIATKSATTTAARCATAEHARRCRVAVVFLFGQHDTGDNLVALRKSGYDLDVACRDQTELDGDLLDSAIAVRNPCRRVRATA